MSIIYSKGNTPEFQLEPVILINTVNSAKLTKYGSVRELMTTTPCRVKTLYILRIRAAVRPCLTIYAINKFALFYHISEMLQVVCACSVLIFPYLTSIPAAIAVFPLE